MMAFRHGIIHRLRLLSATRPAVPAPARLRGALVRVRDRWALLRPDIPFSREDANQYLPWVVGLMVCLSEIGRAHV